MQGLIKVLISEERNRNPPVEPPTPVPGSGIDEQYLRELIRRILNEEYRPDPNDPYLREAIKQVLAEEATHIEEKHAEIAFKQQKTVVRPEESLTTNDRNEIDFYARSPGIGTCVLTVIMLSYGVFPKKMASLVQKFQSKLDVDEEDGDGGDSEADDSEGGSGFSAVQSHIFKALAMVSPSVLTLGQFIYIFYIFRRSSADIGEAFDMCPGQLEEFRAPSDVRVIMAFISALFVVKNVQTLHAYLSALKGRSESAALAKKKGGNEEEGEDVEKGGDEDKGGDIEKGGDDEKGGDEEEDGDEEEGGKSGAQDAGKMKNVRDSWIFPFYALDCIINLLMTYFVLICNLYTVFVSAASPQEMLAKTVVLNFIFEQLPSFKRAILDGKVGKGLLAGLRAAHSVGPRGKAWATVCRRSANVVPTAARLLSVLPIVFPMVMIVYGPICKPVLGQAQAQLVLGQTQSQPVLDQAQAQPVRTVISAVTLLDDSQYFQ